MLRPERLPEEMRALRRWVVAGADSKAPMTPLMNLRASTSNPLTWGTFEDATRSLRLHWGSYLGFVFAGDGIVGIDIDDCIQHGDTLTDTAVDILNHVRSYWEVSRSGTGIHIICKGKLPFAGKNSHQRGVEIYQTGRYFIITGNGTVNTLSECQDGIDYVLGKYFPEETRAATGDGKRQRAYNPVWEAPKANRVPLRPKYPRIPQGGRNMCLTSLGGLLHGLGFSPDKIYQELLYANREACDPPLMTEEIEQIVNSVIRYQR